MASVKVTVSNGAGWMRYYDTDAKTRAYIARAQVRAVSEALSMRNVTTPDGRNAKAVTSGRRDEETGALVEYTVQRFIDVLGRDYYVCTCPAQDTAQDGSWVGGHPTCKHAEYVRIMANAKSAADKVLAELKAAEKAAKPAKATAKA